MIAQSMTLQKRGSIVSIVSMIFHSQCNIGLKTIEYGTALFDETNDE